MSSLRPVDTAAEDEPRTPAARGAMEDSSSEHDSADEYDILYPDPRGRDIMDNSAFLADWIPDVPKDPTLAFTSSLPVQVTVQVASSLVRRVTYCRFNWKTETLRSFLEVLSWTSVTGVAYSLHRDWLWAAQIGFLFGLVMSICDEVCITGARLLLHRIVAHPDARLLLQRAGFDVATHKRPSSAGNDEAVAIKNVVFGAMALETVHQLYLSTSENIQSFAILTATMGVAYVLMGEVFCLWLPTRRLGLTVQARWTRIPKNWQVHFQRSLLEVTCWVACLSYVYSTTASLYSTVGWSSLLGSALCILGGLDPLDANAIVRLQTSLQQAHA
ncbi:hypothetical protein SPRG_09473 [Saprolegnia parasitica CBS 223.65]|uniref:Uncharacterized protein n=1 Tax=Saprolegnia parasitica (strain CBS 223.65) TaxID=695850 RepID=A0A067C399_SAPPC|nr:hypothetical protein SPRG_09473 [Saprolegnia parasitica CBS 223.65]KDO25224.1 hypothetical protein SPRG_09473 [Saprolegnia parasitica CBS 223.65]|eukprot:XP_012204061.1 hypothetical protein SPRG_09473 [Saprolegnia parasitica CBS 223.65]